jgi:hypothetical protein
VDIGDRRALVHKDEDVRDVSNVRTWTPQDGMERFVDSYALRHIKDNTILSEGAGQCGKFALFHVDRLANHPCEQFRMSLFGRS